MTAIYLATGSNPAEVATLRAWDNETKPLHILVSYVYLERWRKFQAKYPIKTKTTKLDSGAYSAWNAGKTIDIFDLIRESKTGGWTESVALDVIGDAEGSVRNSMIMKAMGSNAYPVFHYGDPWEHLLFYKENFAKVGLSCRFGEAEKDSLKWLDKCYAKAWPYKFHSFGWTKEEVLYRYPFHSADSSSWATTPSMYGRWKYMGSRRKVIGTSQGIIPLRGTKVQDYRAEVAFFYNMEIMLRERWQKELEQFGDHS